MVDGVYDSGIAPFVKVLQAHGIETYESCEGGPGHDSPEPTIRFHGGQPEGLKAVYIAMTWGPLPISKLRRMWSLTEGELEGPTWEMTFWRKATPEDAVNLVDAS